MGFVVGSGASTRPSLMPSTCRSRLSQRGRSERDLSARWEGAKADESRETRWTGVVERDPFGVEDQGFPSESRVRALAWHWRHRGGTGMTLDYTESNSESGDVRGTGLQTLGSLESGIAAWLRIAAWIRFGLQLAPARCVNPFFGGGRSAWSGPVVFPR